MRYHTAINAGTRKGYRYGIIDSIGTGGSRAALAALSMRIVGANLAIAHHTKHLNYAL